MKIRIAMLCVTGLITGLVSFTAISQEIHSLRGPAPIDAVVDAPDMKKVQRDQAPIPRTYVQQPPLIPHTIRGYKIDQRNNRCLNCHSWQNYRTYNATKVSQTHFTDSNGIDLADISPRRYFCTQCHVTQTDAIPLVANDFKEVDALSHQ